MVPGSPYRRRRAAFAGMAVAALAAGSLAVAAPATAATTLAGLAAAKGKDIGFAMAPNRMSETAYKTIADNEFNLVVAENAMKWDATEPTQGQFRWTDADTVANYAASTGKELYGHTLVWHSQLPGWVSNLSADQLRSAMNNHITTVVSRYRGKVSSWDVVNEAFSDNGDGSRRSNSVFQQKLGDGYIAEAMRTARAADPNAKLCINDYSTDGINAKSTGLYNLVRSFKTQGVPIDCVGFQAHLIVGQVPGDMQANLQRFIDLGVDVRVTELDIRMQLPADANKLAQQAADYKKVMQICLNLPRCQGVTIWGITDRYSWIPDVFPGQGAALVWDENYQAKPAYAALTEALGGGGTGGDTVAPTAPGQPVAGTVTSSSVALSWPAATDNVGVTGYTVYRENGATDVAVATSAGTSATVSGLSAATAYTFYVVARDAAGNVSAASPTVTATTGNGTGGGACRVGYTVNQWNNGFTANLTVTNTGTSAVNGWALTFAFSAGQTVTQSWSSLYTQSGSQVTLRNEAWNGQIAPGASVSLGFNANHSGSNPAPTAFSLNGAACTLG